MAFPYTPNLLLDTIKTFPLYPESFTGYGKNLSPKKDGKNLYPIPRKGFTSPFPGDEKALPERETYVFLSGLQ